MEQENLTEEDAAKKIGVSRVSLLLERQAGRIQYYRVRRRVLYSPRHIREYMERQEAQLKGERKKAA